MTLTICSLLGVLLLQVYFGFQVYQQHSTALEREVDRALDEAIVTADGNRINQINELFAWDIRNPELVKLSLKQEEGEPKILLSDPETGNVHVSIRFREEVDSTRITQQLQEEMIKYNRNFLEEGSVMYWTDKVGERLARYSDSVQISKAFLLEEIRNELDTLNIGSDFRIILNHDSTSIGSTDGISIGPRAAPVKIEGYDSAIIKLNTPGWEVLRRSGFVYLMTAIILLLITGSFLVLLRFVRRQKRLSQLKDDFIDNVTHELITPITTLKLALDTLSKDKTISQSNSYLAMSQQQTQRIAEVVDHILQVSFVDEQQAGLHFEEVDLNTMIEEILDYYQFTAQKPLTINASLNKNYVIQTDAKHLLNVLHNLIGNAVKYSSENGATLDISVSEKGNTLQVSIGDDGPGIPPAEQEYIFDKFHRVSNGQTHEVRGMGIGLYYVKGIMEQLGGELQLTSSTPSGSTFSITLPYQNPKS